MNLHTKWHSIEKIEYYQKDTEYYIVIYDSNMSTLDIIQWDSNAKLWYNAISDEFYSTEDLMYYATYFTVITLPTSETLTE